MTLGVVSGLACLAEVLGTRQGALVGRSIGQIAAGAHKCCHLMNESQYHSLAWYWGGEV